MEDMNREPRSVLIIDDDKNLADMLQEMFARTGWLPFAASTPEDGLELAQSRRPDVILCDYAMPRATGAEIIASLRAVPQLAGTPIVLMSAFSIPGEKDIAADAILAKPFLLSHLRLVLRGAWEARQPCAGESSLAA